MRLFILVASVAAGLATAVAAFAHAEPAAVSPGDGAVLTTPPRFVTMTMTQEMARQPDANDIDLIGPGGTEVTAEAATISDTNRRLLTVNLPQDLPPGDYVVRWKTTSAEDGDTAKGETRFRLDPNGTPSAGKEVLKGSVLESGTPAAESPSAALGDGGGGTSWVLVVAVGIAAAAVGAGATYLVGPRRA